MATGVASVKKTFTLCTIRVYYDWKSDTLIEVQVQLCGQGNFSIEVECYCMETPVEKKNIGPYSISQLRIAVTEYRSLAVYNQHAFDVKLDNVMGTQTIEEYAAFEIYLQQAQVFAYKLNIDFMIYELITILFICMN